MEPLYPIYYISYRKFNSRSSKRMRIYTPDVKCIREVIDFFLEEFLSHVQQSLKLYALESHYNIEFEMVSSQQVKFIVYYQGRKLDEIYPYEIEMQGSF